MLAQALLHKVQPLTRQFLVEPEFSHDFEQVKYGTPVVDETLALRSLQRR